MKYFHLLFFALISYVVSAEEVKQYDILVAGIKIGELSATKSSQDEVTNYSLTSTVNFWFFVRVKVSYSITSSYKDGILVSSYVKTTSTKGNFSSSVVWDRDHYNVKVDTYRYKKDTILNSPIFFNVARLYFEEPQSVKALLADNYGELTEAEPLEKNIYQVMITGNKSRYFYEKGEMRKAIMHNPIKNFEVKRRSNDH